MPDQDQTPTLEIGEAIEAALAADKTTVLTASSDNPDRTPRAAVIAAVEKIRAAGRSVIAAEAATRSAWNGVTDSVHTLRSRLLLENGRRDWNGSSVLYKTVLHPEIIAAVLSADSDTLKVRNAVQKNTVRGLPRFVLGWIVKHDGLEVSTEELARLLSLVQPKVDTSLADVIAAAKKAAKKQSEEASGTLLARLVEELSSDAKRNAKRKPPAVETPEEAAAVETRTVVDSFSAGIASETVPVDTAGTEIREASRVLFTRVFAADKNHPVRFGNGGLGAFSADVQAAIVWLTSLDLYVNGKPLTAERKAALKALAPQAEEAPAEAPAEAVKPKRTAAPKRTRKPKVAA